VVVAGVPTASPARANRRGSLLWVTAGAPERALGLARGFGPGPHYLVSTRPPRNGRVRFRVAGCTGVSLGQAARHPARRAA
jgi:hypothetical protein